MSCQSFASFNDGDNDDDATATNERIFNASFTFSTIFSGFRVVRKWK